MSPKKWSNVVKIAEGQIIEVLKNHSKAIRRLGWKAMDPSEFSESFFSLCKAIAEHTVRLSSGKLRSAISKSKLGLSQAEGHLLAEKIPNSFTWAKTKLRDSGSGNICQPQ